MDLRDVLDCAVRLSRGLLPAESLSSGQGTVVPHSGGSTERASGK